MQVAKFIDDRILSDSVLPHSGLTKVKCSVWLYFDYVTFPVGQSSAFVVSPFSILVEDDAWI